MVFQTSPASYWTNTNSIKYIVVFLFSVWLISATSLAIYANQIYIFNGTTSSLAEDKSNDIYVFLKRIVEDEYNCYYCINTNSSTSAVRHMIEINQNYHDGQLEMSLTRSLFNIFGFLNIIIVYFVYGGPLLINILALINCVMLLASLFIKQLSVLVWMESFVVFMFVFIVLQTSYVLIINVCRIIWNTAEKSQ